MAGRTDADEEIRRGPAAISLTRTRQKVNSQRHPDPQEHEQFFPELLHRSGVGRFHETPHHHESCRASRASPGYQIPQIAEILNEMDGEMNESSARQP